MQSEALSLMGQGMQHVLQVKEEKCEALQEQTAASTPPGVRCEQGSCVKCGLDRRQDCFYYTHAYLCVSCVFVVYVYENVFFL